MKRTLNFSEEKLLLFSVFVLSLCGIIYELVLGSLATYLLGNPVQQYSITIGVFLSSMGIGSFLSRFLVNNILRDFIIIETALGFTGGLSVLVLSMVFSFSPSYYLLHLFFLVLIGTMVGLEIPLLTRILKKHGAFKDIISNVLTLDYMGGLAGSLLFPLLLFPVAGRLLSSFIIGLINMGVALLVMVKIEYPGKRKLHLLVPALLIVLLSILAYKSDALTQVMQRRLYYDDIIYSKRSDFQEIVLTRSGRDFRLYLDGSLQFSASDEYRYHEMLVFPALFMNGSQSKDVIVLGGGDGLAVREILRKGDVKSVTLVELDRAMIDLARYNSSMSMLNKKSLENSRVRVIVGEAYSYLMKSSETYDIIIADFPDPHDETISKLYSVEFFSLVRRSLKPGGIFVTQSTSPLFARDAFWCINRTLGRVFRNVVPYHVFIPSFGDWGFNIASNENINPVSFKPDKREMEGFSYFSWEAFINSLYFPMDTSISETGINSFNRPVLYSYYLKGWKNSDY